MGTILSATGSTFNNTELVGQNVSVLVPSPWKERHKHFMRMYQAMPPSTAMYRTRSVLLEVKGGEAIPVTLSMSEVLSDGVWVYNVQIERVDPSVELVFTLTQGGTIQSCNSLLVTPLLGYNARELVHSNISMIVPALINAPGGSVLCTPTAAVYPAIFKGGTSIQVSTSVYPFTVLDMTLYSCRIRRMPPSLAVAIDGQSLFTDLTLGPIVGVGCHGVVRLGVMHGDDSLVAVKLLHVVQADPVSVLCARSEVNVMQKLAHPNVPHLFYAVQAPDMVALVMEYCGGGSLNDYVKCRGGLCEAEARHYFQQLVSVVSYLHGLGVIHRDIKLDNILMQTHRDWHCTQIKLCDYSLSTFVQESSLLTTFCGTPAYVAPEVALSQSYVGPSADVWSMGVVLHAMLAGNVPFSNMAAVLSSAIQPPASASEPCAALLRRCLDRSVRTRIRLAEVLQHPWMTAMGDEAALMTAMGYEAPPHQPKNGMIPSSEVVELSSVDSNESLGKRLKLDPNGGDICSTVADGK
jgi:serine/threonine protein kinase